jgi:hypothetical protein
MDRNQYVFSQSAKTNSTESPNSMNETLLISQILFEVMRGRWASAALGAGMARRQASYEMDQQAHAYEMQQRNAQQQIEAQQRQIEALQRQKQQPQQQQPHSQHDDITQKLLKYSELKKQGVLTEEEFQKLKMDLLSKL